MKKVFISHPYAHDPQGNKEKVDKICKKITGATPISPIHLFCFYDDDNHREEIMNVCKKLIDFCDEVWVYGLSKGCREEIEYAFSIGKCVRWMGS